MMRLFCWALFLIFLCAVTPAMADKPPQALFEHVTSTAQLVHNGTCNVPSMKKKDTTCLIFYNAPQEIIWLVLFDKDKNGAPSVTHVVAVKDEKESVVWCRVNVCL
jgi:hypothetical protein